MSAISEDELYVLSFYRASELAGSMLFGRLAFHTTIDELRAPLTRHCLEEAEHAWLWTQTIQELGHTPLRVTQTYQAEYSRELGLPQDTLELLCLTQVLEKRVLVHFRQHLEQPGTHELIRRALQQMLDDEVGHIGWVRQKLDAYAAEGPEQQGRLEASMARIEAVDQRAWERLALESRYRRFFQPAETGAQV